MNMENPQKELCGTAAGVEKLTFRYDALVKADRAERLFIVAVMSGFNVSNTKQSVQLYA